MSFLSPGKPWNLVFASPGKTWKTVFYCLYEPCFNEARDDAVTLASAGPFGHMQIICTRSREITTPAPHNSIFYGTDALSAAQRTVK